MTSKTTMAMGGSPLEGIAGIWDDRTITLPGVALCLPGHGMCFIQVEMRDIARW